MFSGCSLAHHPTFDSCTLKPQADHILHVLSMAASMLQVVLISIIDIHMCWPAGVHTGLYGSLI